MLAKVKSCAVFGMDGFIVDVEVDISPGLPRFDVVGLPDAAVQERGRGSGRRFSIRATNFRRSASPRTWPRRT